MTDSRFDQLSRLRQLKDQGILDEHEYLTEKARLLSDAPDQADSARYWGMPRDVYLMLLHLAQFAGSLVPLAGLILPIVMWASYRRNDPEIDVHGRIVINWMLSLYCYLALSLLLCFVLIGIPLVAVVVICMIVFPIIGAVRASDGVAWAYPLSIPFLGRTAVPA